jgi:hypothetical protein
MPRAYSIRAANTPHTAPAAPEPERVPCERCGIPSKWAVLDRGHLCAGCCQLREPEGRQKLLPFEGKAK